MAEPGEHAVHIQGAGVPKPRLVEAPASAGADAVLSSIGDLEIAHEELRVAEEELVQQQAQLEELLTRYDRSQRWRDQLFALLPIGVLVTDADGVVRETNASAAELLGVRAARLPGKPLPVYVATEQRRIVRDLLARLGQGATGLEATVTLTPRDGHPVVVHLIALPESDHRQQQVLRWLLVPQAPAGITAVGPAAVGPLSTRPADGSADDSLGTASALARLCTLPIDASDQHRLLGQIALVVASAVPSATAVSVTIGDPTAPRQQATDSGAAQVLDGLQERAGEGPCLQAFSVGDVVVTGDVTADVRWPRLAALAGSQPLRSVLALPIRMVDDRAGVVNVYATAPDAFSERAVRVGEVVASAVAAVLRGASERASLEALVAHLERALTSRAVIEQAKGVVMAHHGGTADEAFARLVAYSSRHNVKLRDLAALIVHDRSTTPLRGL